MLLFDCVGKTPLIFLPHLSRLAGANIFIKDESRNPGGSIKDRVALAYVGKALERGNIKRKKAVVEAASGTLGLSLAMVCAAAGLTFYLAHSGPLPPVQRRLLGIYGAACFESPGAGSLTPALELARAQSEDIWGAWLVDQCENPDGPAVHYQETGPELLADCREQGFCPDVFLDAVASGATISGVGRYLKENLDQVHIVAVEPAESAVLSGATPGPNIVPGMGFGFVPRIFERQVVDEIVAVPGAEAFKAARRLARTEYVMACPATGASLYAAVNIARRKEYQGKNIVLLARESALHYAGTPLLDE